MRAPNRLEARDAAQPALGDAEISDVQPCRQDFVQSAVDCLDEPKALIIASSPPLEQKGGTVLVIAFNSLSPLYRELLYR